jgi:hypothetical protein
MRCLITSFQRSHGLEAVFSAAVYQPKGYNYPKAEWADIRRDGVWTRPRDFIGEPDPLAAYRNALLHLYGERHRHIEDWLEGVKLGWGDQFVLCCWCPYDRAAQRQLGEHGSFVCHTAVIGEVLERDHDVQVFYDSDRRLMKVLP